MLHAILEKMIRSFDAEAAQVKDGGAGLMPMEYRRQANARRYILRVNAAGNGGCVTIPRGGSRAEAEVFAKRNLHWLEKRLRQMRETTAAAAAGEDTIFFRGEEMTLAALEAHSSLSGLVLRRTAETKSAGARLKLKLWQLAWQELPARVNELAAVHGLNVRRVSVRNQRARWGSCSAFWLTAPSRTGHRLRDIPYRPTRR